MNAPANMTRAARTNQTREKQPTTGQIVNGRQPLFCTTSSGEVRICMDSRTMHAGHSTRNDILPRQPLTPELARNIISSHKRVITEMLTSIANGDTKYLCAPCQRHPKGFVPAIRLFGGHNKKDRNFLAGATRDELHVICPRGKYASQRDNCLREAMLSGDFPCLSRLTAG